MNIDDAHIRIAHPTSDPARIRRSYIDGIGMSILYEGEAQLDHQRWELLMCRFEHASWHLEFTHSEPHATIPSPTAEDLLVLYLGDPASVERVSTALEDHGGTVVRSDNPYWDNSGITVMDPDGYRLVLTAQTWGVGMRTDRGVQPQGKEPDMVDLSYEVFHRDIDALVDFYVEALDFQPPESDPTTGYAIVRRGGVWVGCRRHDHAGSTPRRPPDGSEIALRVDDFQAEYDRVLASGWPLADSLQDRPWELRDVRFVDLSGQYPRLTSTTPEQPRRSRA